MQSWETASFINGAMNSLAKERKALFSPCSRGSLLHGILKCLRSACFSSSPGESSQTCVLWSLVKETKLDEFRVDLGAKFGLPRKEGCIQHPRKPYRHWEGGEFQVLWGGWVSLDTEWWPWLWQGPLYWALSVMKALGEHFGVSPRATELVQAEVQIYTAGVTLVTLLVVYNIQQLISPHCSGLDSPGILVWPNEERKESQKNDWYKTPHWPLWVSLRARFYLTEKIKVYVILAI